MSYYIVQLSKYGIAVLAILYTLECFLVCGKKDEETSYGNFSRQNFYMFGIQFLGYLTMFLKTKKIEYLFFFAFLQIALSLTRILYQSIYPYCNTLLINNMRMLLSTGLMMLTRLNYEKAIKQFFIVVVTMAGTLMIPFLIHKMRFLRHLKWLYGILGIVALGAVLILGQVTHGSKISYTIAGITLQPSEFVKIIFAFFIAAMLYEAVNLREIGISAIFAGIHVLILVLSKDLGSSIIFFMGYLFMILIASGNYLYLLAGGVGGGLAAIIGYFLFSHVRVRVQAFLDPFTLIDNQGYQISQSLFAIGSGKWFGMGLYQGTPSDIPFVEADFIFSAIAEELGGIYAICLILICLTCFFTFLKIGTLLQDTFYRLLACGLGVMYIFQVFLTVGGGMKFIPLTGVTLPLVSYGGSSVLTTLIMFAIMQGLYMIHFVEKIEADKVEAQILLRSGVNPYKNR